MSGEAEQIRIPDGAQLQHGGSYVATDLLEELKTVPGESCGVPGEQRIRWETEDGAAVEASHYGNGVWNLVGEQEAGHGIIYVASCMRRNETAKTIRAVIREWNDSMQRSLF